MTKNEKDLLARILDDYCLYLQTIKLPSLLLIGEDALPGDWSDIEKIDFIKKFRQINRSIREVDPNDLTLPLECVVAVLAEKVKEL